jgi:hypothetical protein
VVGWLKRRPSEDTEAAANRAAREILDTHGARILNNLDEVRKTKAALSAFGILNLPRNEHGLVDLERRGHKHPRGKGKWSPRVQHDVPRCRRTAGRHPWHVCENPQSRCVALLDLPEDYTISWTGWSQTVTHLMHGRLITAFRQLSTYYRCTAHSRLAAFRKLIIEPLVAERGGNWIDRRRGNRTAPWQDYAAIQPDFAWRPIASVFPLSNF